MDKTQAKGHNSAIGAPSSLATYRLPEVIKDFSQNSPQVKMILNPGPY
jgi:DNA-binding transcriptional LysR family regulator